MANDLEGRVRLLEDIIAIQALKIQYASHCDRNYDPEALAELFVPEGVWDGGAQGRYEGRPAIKEFFRRASKTFPFALHYVANGAITVTGDEARGSWYLFMTATRAAPSGDVAIWNAVRYEDEFLRVDGGWRFTVVRVANRFFMTAFDQGWVKQRFI